jgi:predicted CopG family antitoxin
MGSRPYFHILLFFFILSMKVDSDMSETPKKKLCERRTISFDGDLYALALQRMKQEGETMFSRYVQSLVRKDTARLRAEALANEIPAVQEKEIALVADDSPEYGNKGNEIAPPARRSLVSYTPKRIKPTK